LWSCRQFMAYGLGTESHSAHGAPPHIARIARVPPSEPTGSTSARPRRATLFPRYTARAQHAERCPRGQARRHNALARLAMPFVEPHAPRTMFVPARPVPRYSTACLSNGEQTAADCRLSAPTTQVTFTARDTRLAAAAAQARLEVEGAWRRPRLPSDIANVTNAYNNSPDVLAGFGSSSLTIPFCLRGFPGEAVVGQVPRCGGNSGSRGQISIR